MVQAIDASKNRPSDPRNQEVVFPAEGDPMQGNLDTPINASSFSKWYINNLPAYRAGLTPFRRGLEVGMAHGYFVFGPFAKLGPLRNTPNANLAGLLAAIGLIVISSGAIALYANSNPKPALGSVTVPNPPDAFTSKEGWNNYSSAFLIGGIGGAVVAYFLTSNLGILQSLAG